MTLDALHSKNLELPYTASKSSSLGSVTNLDDLRAIQAEGDKEAALRKVSKQFESMFVNMLFKSMRQANAVFEEGNFGKSNADSVYRDMYDQQLSLRISEGKGIGIADMVYKQLKGPERVEPNIEGLDANSPSQSLLRQFTDVSPYAVGELSRENISDNSSLLHAGKSDTSKLNDPLLNSSQLGPSQLDSPQLGNKAIPAEHKFSAANPQSFVDSLKPIVADAAQKMGLDPLIMVAQAALETGWGKYVLKDSHGKTSNNLFNIKADQRWDGPKVTTQTLEYRDGIAVKESAKFRRYDSAYQSVADYLNFIQVNSRYSQAIEHADNPEKYIDELHSAGYATDPQYAQKIKSIYRQLTHQEANSDLEIKTENSDVNNSANPNVSKVGS